MNRKPTKATMLLILPDKSRVNFDTKTGRFYSVNGTKTRRRSSKPAGLTRKQLSTPLREFIRTLERPTLPYNECFRRICDLPRYSPIRVKHKFDLTLITSYYNFQGNYQGGTFCSSETAWRFLDGGIFEHNGYGWGSHSWTVVQGAEALRVVCMVCGVQQPLRLKGERPRRRLSVLLEEISIHPRTGEDEGLAIKFPSPAL